MTHTHTHTPSELGVSYGKRAAEQLFDGNTSIDTYRALVDDDGELFAQLTEHLAPLSGEWAGESLVEIFGYHPSDDDCTDFEGEYWDTLATEVTRIARDHVTAFDIGELENENAHQLAGRADCVSPDSADSPGAQYLDLVRDSVLEAVRYNLENNETNQDPTDIAHEAVDGCVPIYTHNLWLTFADLAAYQEDPTEFGCDGSDMEQAARVCLYMIGERLAHDILDAIGMQS